MAGQWRQPWHNDALEESCSVLCCCLGDRVSYKSTVHELTFKLLETCVRLLTLPFSPSGRNLESFESPSPYFKSDPMGAEPVSDE